MFILVNINVDVSQYFFTVHLHLQFHQNSSGSLPTDPADMLTKSKDYLTITAITILLCTFMVLNLCLTDSKVQHQSSS